MSHIKLVTSGKGGAGKSTVSVYTAAALASPQYGKRVLLLEMDAGLRGLDIMLGASDRTVFDMGDVLESRCEPIKAIVACGYLRSLHFMPAPTDRGFCPKADDLRRLCKGLSEYYDYLIIDTPAGLGVGFDVSLSVADSAFLVATPDPISMWDAASVAGLLFEGGIDDTKLIINRIPQRPAQMPVENLDAVIDAVGVQLIGALPEEREVARCAALGRPLPSESPAAKEFLNIAGRMQGLYIPLDIR